MIVGPGGLYAQTIPGNDSWKSRWIPGNASRIPGNDSAFPGNDSTFPGNNSTFPPMCLNRFHISWKRFHISWKQFHFSRKQFHISTRKCGNDSIKFDGNMESIPSSVSWKRFQFSRNRFLELGVEIETSESDQLLPRLQDGIMMTRASVRS